MVRDIRGIDLIKIVTTQSVFKIFAWNFRNRLEIAFPPYFKYGFLIKASKKIWRPNSEFLWENFGIWPPNFFWGLNQKSVFKIRWKCNFESIPKISCKNFENWLSCYNFNEINSANIANQDTGNLVHFLWFFRLSIQI